MAPPEKQALLSHKAKHTLSCYALLAASVGLLCLFVYVPVIWAFTKSLYQFEVGGKSTFIGLDNYAEFLTRDPIIWPAFANLAVLCAVAVLFRLTVPLVVAKLIYELPHERARYAYRILFLVPIVVPLVAVQLIWSGLVYADHGLLNEALALMGLDDWTTNWLANPRTALFAVAFVGFPFVGGIEVLIYYAGLSGIPQSVNEAAKLEGCTGLRKFFHIDIPMVMSQLKLILILTVIVSVQGYEHVLILTRGGPGFETMVPGLWMYFNGFSFQKMGYACAIGVCLFGIIFVLTFLNMRYFRSSEELQNTP